MKMKNLSLLLLTLTLFFISICSQHVHQMQLVYRWPETYCNKKPMGKCDKIPPMNFTLVGFWGINSNGDILDRCSDTETHEWDKVFNDDMVKKLDPFWPSLTTEQDQKDMWRKAWETYGACTIFKTPTEYFNMVAKQAKKIGNLLENHLIKSDGIVPCDSATYDNVEILNSLRQVSNKKDVSFTCKLVHNSNTHAYLNQVTFCYSNNARSYSNCLPSFIKSKRCGIQNIIVPRPPAPAPAPAPTPTPFMQALQTTKEKLQPNSLWEIFGQLI